MLYDLKRDPAHRDTLSYVEDGERYSMYYLLPRSREDLVRRMRAHKAIAAASYGLMGRSPDHVASFVAGMALQPEALGAECGGGKGYRRQSSRLLSSMPAATTSTWLMR